MMKVSEDGGAVKQLTLVDQARGETIHFLPSFLPDGHHFLYFRGSPTQGKSGLYLASIDAEPSQQPLNRILDSPALYVGSGRLIFSRGTTLMTQGFDPDRTNLVGEPTQIAEGTLYSGASMNGVLAYGGVGSAVQLTWFDRQGKTMGTIGAPGPVWHPRISPDDVTVAFNRFDTGPGDIWLYEPKRGAFQFTFGNDRDSPVWSPDGSHLAFVSLAAGGWSLTQKASNGVGDEESLYEGPGYAAPSDWSRDGKYLFFEPLDPKTKIDVWVLPIGGDKKPFPYLNSDYNEFESALSPDGRWLAYQSDRTGRYEVYVDTFTGTPSGASSAARGTWTVSTNGGNRPVWSRDGKELYFISADRKMMAAEVSTATGDKFEFSSPKALFDARVSGVPWDRFDVSKDGRFLMPVPVEQGSSTPITVIINWAAGLKK